MLCSLHQLPSSQLIDTRQADIAICVGLEQENSVFLRELAYVVDVGSRDVP